MSRSRKEYTHSIVAQLEDWQLSYNLSSEKSWRDSYFSELLEISAKVLYSENKKIPVYRIINFYIVVEHNMKNYIDKPKLVSVFNNCIASVNAGSITDACKKREIPNIL